VTLNLIVGGVVIGQATILNALLTPGNNTVQARGTADIKTALKNLAVILKSQIMPLMNGNVEISASGNSTIYQGQHIPYFEDVLNNLTLTTQTPLLSLLLGSVGGILQSGALNNLTSLLSGLNLTSLIPILVDTGASSSSTVVEELTNLNTTALVPR
jgi:hypothetical protein